MTFFFKIILLFVYTFCLGVSGVSLAQNSKSFSRAAQIAQKSIWQISNHTEGKTHYRTANGFFIASNLMLTNFHVMRDFIISGTKLQDLNLQQYQNGDLFTSNRRILKILRVSVLPDLALLQIEDDSSTEYLSGSLRFLNLNYNTNDFFTIVGYSANKLIERQKQAAMTYESLYYSFVFFAGYDPFIGMSGSPILDESGQVSGIFKATSRPQPKVLFHSNELIINFLNKDFGMDCFNKSSNVCINEAISKLPKVPEAKAKFKKIRAQGNSNF